MKKYIFLLGLAVTSFAQAQTKDSVSVEAGYAKQVYYSLEDGEQASVNLASWDLAFGTGGQGSSIRFNGATGNLLYTYPNGDISNWQTVDTTGIGSWSSIYDSDTAWDVTAFNKVTNNDFDLGWGVYNMITHLVSGDSVYVAKIGTDYKKFFIQKLQSGTYHLVHANLDGSGADTSLIAKADFSGKNFGYYSFSSNSTLDLEPMADSWDLVFTKYLTEITGYGAYGVTGVLANQGVEIAVITDGSTINEVNSVDFNFDFSSKINAIGYSWKTYDFATNAYLIEDSSIFVIKDVNGKNWNFELLQFGGSANGKIVFQKIDQNIVGLFDTPIANKIQYYPNPASIGQSINIELPTDEVIISVQIFDTKGQLVSNSQEAKIETDQLTTGFYSASVTTNKSVFTAPILIQF